jgi:hypothetical protein
MAWELQSDMAGLIRPSVESYLLSHDDAATEAGRILCYQRSEGEMDIASIERLQAECDDDVERLGLDWAIGAISDHAEQVATTSNGAWDVYLDSEGWCEVPFCSDEKAQEYYG